MRKLKLHNQVETVPLVTVSCIMSPVILWEQLASYFVYQREHDDLTEHCQPQATPCSIALAASCSAWRYFITHSKQYNTKQRILRNKIPSMEYTVCLGPWLWSHHFSVQMSAQIPRSRVLLSSVEGWVARCLDTFKLQVT